MILCDLHVHTTYCDGKSTVKETADWAQKLGMKSLGFSGHGFIEFDQSYCMSPEGTQKYMDDVNAIKGKYETDIYLGLEKDLYGENSREGFDYIIGSAHYVKKDGLYRAVDISEEDFLKDVRELFGGDFYAYCRNYYEGIAERLPGCKADIVGHIDLVTKFNSGGKRFDETDKRYRSAVFEALEAVKDACPLLEMNTGAISRGYRKTPYPRPFILQYILDNGMNVILNSDCHYHENLCFKYTECIDILKSVGFRNVVAMIDGKLQEVAI